MALPSGLDQSLILSHVGTDHDGLTLFNQISSGLSTQDSMIRQQAQTIAQLLARIKALEAKVQ